jgi:ribonuclease BN (tRNA processing enzyme)
VDDDRVRVTFAGSGDAFGSGGRLQACIHIQPPGSRPALLLDCGATSLVGLKRYGFDLGHITTVVVSHLHGDHFGGLPFLILDGQFGRRTAPLTVAGPEGIARRLTSAMEVMFPGSSTTPRRFDVHTVELHPDHVRQFDDVRVRVFEVDHPSGAPAFALRVTIGDATIAYTGDTAWTDNLLDAAAGVDLLIAEAYHWTKPVPYHLTHEALASRRDQLSAARVILTHMSAEMLSHASHTPFETAYDGLTVHV